MFDRVVEFIDKLLEVDKGLGVALELGLPIDGFGGRLELYFFRIAHMLREEGYLLFFLCQSVLVYLDVLLDFVYLLL